MGNKDADYVACPHTITSPAPMQDWIPANVPCAQRVPVINEADVMLLRCGRGHGFYAMRKDIVRG